MAGAEGFVPIRTAIFSVSDKTGLAELGKEMTGFGVEILATGGTYSALKAVGVKVTSLQDDMNLPTAISGRVKTLHAPLQAAILARDTPQDLAELESMGVRPVELVVCNFYPFAEARRKGLSEGDLVESIDIGGPTMVRGASKNYARVAVLSSPSQYDDFLQEMRKTGGGTSLGFRKRLAVEAFSSTSSYDFEVFNGLSGTVGEAFPERFVLSATKVQDAKYGENPDTKAAIYSLDGWRSMAGWKQLAGEPMSFNNFLDAGSAYEIAEGFGGKAAVATVKHGQISGFAFAPTVAEGYSLAHACDPEADFGGCVVTNSEVGVDAARLIGKNEGVQDSSVYTEIIVAPSFTPEAMGILASKQKKKIRLVQAETRPDYPYDVKVLEGALLLQGRVDYGSNLDRGALTFPTKRRPDGAQLEKLLAAWEVVRKVRSNGIVIAEGSLEDGGKLKQFWTLGVASFRKRNGAIRIALQNAGTRAAGAVCASDGFLPFRDNVDLLAEAKISAVIQPGGSARDSEVVEAADENGIAMAFTHTRAFKH